VPITANARYIAKVTSTPEQPTLADVMAAIGALVLKVEGIDNKTDDLTTATAQGFGHVMTELAGVKADIAAVKDELRGEIRATEASLIARIDAVQQVVRSVKADIASHAQDGPHHRHAA
jgi:hypothetical protein